MADIPHILKERVWKELDQCGAISGQTDWIGWISMKIHQVDLCSLCLTCKYFYNLASHPSLWYSTNISANISLNISTIISSNLPLIPHSSHRIHDDDIHKFSQLFRFGLNFGVSKI